MSTPTTQNSDKPKYHPCNVCGVDAVACLSPDMDIKGLCYCEEHVNEVRGVYVLLMTGGKYDDEIKEMMKDWKHK